MLFRHLFVGRQQHNVIESPARSVQVMPVVADVRVHQKRLAGTRRALIRQDAQLIGRVLRDGEHFPPTLPCLIQVCPGMSTR